MQQLLDLIKIRQRQHRVRLKFSAHEMKGLVTPILTSARDLRSALFTNFKDSSCTLPFLRQFDLTKRIHSWDIVPCSAAAIYM